MIITFESFKKLQQPVYGRIDWKDENGKSHWVEYCKTTDFWAVENGFEFEIFFETTQTKRFANIKKTVAYVCVDEDENGKPILDKWLCKNRKYDVA